MIKKFFILSVVLVVIFSLSCSRREDKRLDPINVAVIFSFGGLGDRSFNDSAYDGLKLAENQLGINYDYFVPDRYEEDVEKATEEIIMALEDYAVQGYDLIIAVGYEMSEPVFDVASNYPSVKFAVIDGELDIIPNNMVSIVFAEHEGSFLAGALAAFVSESNIIGFIGGADVPLIHKFEGGYKEGAKYVKNRIRDIEEGVYDDLESREVEIQPEGLIIPEIVNLIVQEKELHGYSSELTILTDYVGGFSNPDKAREIALKQVEAGADVIFHAAGGSGLGLFEVANEKGVYTIGVDANQNHEAPGYVIASMLKRIDVAVYDVIRDVQAGNFEGGLEKVFDLRRYGVGLTDLVHLDDDEIFAKDSGLITETELNAIEDVKKEVTRHHYNKMQVILGEFLGGNIIVPNWLEGRPE